MWVLCFCIRHTINFCSSIIVKLAQYNGEQIFTVQTYTGSILIAVNPFQRLPHLYDSHMMAQYKGAAFGELSPHPFAVADAAYRYEVPCIEWLLVHTYILLLSSPTMDAGLWWTKERVRQFWLAVRVGLVKQKARSCSCDTLLTWEDDLQEKEGQWSNKFLR